MTDPRFQPGEEIEADEPASHAGASAPDQWAHRRAEPRLFAFLWTVYLFVTVLGSLLWLSRSGVLAASAYGPAARVMLIVIAAGATILWPMVRLSQIVPDTRPISAAFSDLVVIAMPVQVVVWPLAFLANWPVPVVALLASMLLAWSALSGGIVAIAFALCHRRAIPALPAPARVFLMLSCIALVCAGPLVVILTGVGQGADVTSWAWKLSPFTFIFLLTGTGLRGPHNPIGFHDWYALLPVVAAGLFAWLLASGLAGRRSPATPRGRVRAGSSGRSDPGTAPGSRDNSGGPEPATSLDSQTNS